MKPNYFCSVISSSYDEAKKKWQIEAQNTISGDIKVYILEFLVVATSENCKGFIPKLLRLDNFEGDIIHSSEYKSGLAYQGKQVLVFGSANSGMEIAYDLSNFGAYASIVARSPIHLSFSLYFSIHA
ncbi:hypothetical protein L1049_019306 [Liquidambar formosana]|uniref:Flavin-containing monooxygenase n=1 Tax=Liquidambar formosana TaxID=63359 RepID=A0AAP0S5K9_LIQFO